MIMLNLKMGCQVGQETVAKVYTNKQHKTLPVGAEWWSEILSIKGTAFTLPFLWFLLTIISKMIP